MIIYHIKTKKTSMTQYSVFKAVNIVRTANMYTLIEGYTHNARLIWIYIPFTDYSSLSLILDALFIHPSKTTLIIELFPQCVSYTVLVHFPHLQLTLKWHSNIRTTHMSLQSSKVSTGIQAIIHSTKLQYNPHKKKMAMVKSSHKLNH